MSFIVKSTAFMYQGLYFRKATPHNIYYTDFPMAAQYFKEENEARVAMIEAGIFHFEVEPAHKDNRVAFVPTPQAANPAFANHGKEIANSRI